MNCIHITFRYRCNTIAPLSQQSSNHQIINWLRVKCLWIQCNCRHPVPKNIPSQNQISEIAVGKEKMFCKKIVRLPKGHLANKIFYTQAFSLSSKINSFQYIKQVSLNQIKMRQRRSQSSRSLAVIGLLTFSSSIQTISHHMNRHMSTDDFFMTLAPLYSQSNQSIIQSVFCNFMFRSINTSAVIDFQLFTFFSSKETISLSLRQRLFTVCSIRYL